MRLGDVMKYLTPISPRRYSGKIRSREWSTTEAMIEANKPKGIILDHAYPGKPLSIGGRQACSIGTTKNKRPITLATAPWQDDDEH